MSILRRLLNLWRGRSLDRDFDDELRFHTEMRVDANIRAGMSRPDAEAEARRHMGSTLLVKENMREARVMCWIESVAHDFHYGARLLIRRPLATALAVLTLSLGIGANVAIFSLLNAALLKPLPLPEADRLVTIVDVFTANGLTRAGPTVPELIDVRKMSPNLQNLSFFDTRDFQLTGGDEPLRVFGARVDALFLTVLGIRPAHGRLFQQGENLPGQDRVVVITDGLWRRNFGGDPSVVGRQIVLNGAASTVLGILPPDFSSDDGAPEPIEIFVPFPMNDTYTLRTAPFANVRRVIAIARLKNDYSIQAAATELQSISRVLKNDHPELYRTGSDGRDTGFVMDVIPLKEAITAGSRSTLMLLFAAVGLVLLIACVNTAQFLLSQWMEREPEVAVRRALGAGGMRLFRQFFIETVILAALGGIAGLLQVAWLIRAFRSFFSSTIPVVLIGSVEIDGTVLAFTAVVALVTTMLCAFVPALRLSRLQPALRDAARGLAAGRSRSRHILIGVEVAISAMLLIVAGLLVQSLHKLQNAPAGYSADGVMVLRMRMLAASPEAILPQYVERVAAIPGVDSAALADASLFGPANVEFAIESRADDAATLSIQSAGYRIVSPDYFKTLRIPLLDGRTFTDQDAAGRLPVAIVNEEMVRRFWPGRSPIGDRIRAGAGPREATMTIVGVAGNVRPVLEQTAEPQIYVPYLQQTEPNKILLVRSSTSNHVDVAAIKAAIRSVQPEQAMFNIQPLTEIVRRSSADSRTIAMLLAGFAALALFMSVTGVYTVVSYLTSRRTKEIAIRVAVGAKARDVLHLVGSQTLVATLAGLGFGLLGSIASGAALRRTLAGVMRVEPVTLVLVSGLYLAVVICAICVPALKAVRVDPSTILRTD